MELATFIKDLLDKGIVTVAGEIVEFKEEDLQQSSLLLRNYYDEDFIEMPHAAPEISLEAAVWGAQYIYRAIQFIMLRNLDGEVIQTHLKEFPGEITHQTIYSVDLTFRYLPDLYDLAKGLAPNDILLKYLNETAAQWPFSSVGVELTEEPEHERVLSNTSLRIKYIDRIIQRKDMKRAHNKAIEEFVSIALGSYGQAFCPEFDLFNKPNESIIEEDPIK